MPALKKLRVPSAAEEPEPADLAPYDSLAQALGGDRRDPLHEAREVVHAASRRQEAGLLKFKNPQTPRGLSGVGTGLAEEILQLFLTTPFEGGRHLRRVEQLMQIERDETARAINNANDHDNPEF